MNEERPIEHMKALSGDSFAKEDNVKSVKFPFADSTSCKITIDDSRHSRCHSRDGDYIHMPRDLKLKEYLPPPPRSAYKKDAP